mgnify:CR=1 FL=1
MKKVKILITVPKEINDLLLDYKQALKRSTGNKKNKDETILDAVMAYAPTLRQRMKRLDAEYKSKMKAK